MPPAKQPPFIGGTQNARVSYRLDEPVHFGQRARHLVLTTFVDDQAVDRTTMSNVPGELAHRAEVIAIAAARPHLKKAYGRSAR